ncbi:uncharacterized protein [Periplaneta americana]|uniref:uncharacterized protein n=1 Tax=Periplaneta americana TaxID=6978 RepID=UPI0037E8C742
MLLRNRRIETEGTESERKIISRENRGMENVGDSEMEGRLELESSMGDDEIIGNSEETQQCSEKEKGEEGTMLGQLGILMKHITEQLKQSTEQMKQNFDKMKQDNSEQMKKMDERLGQSTEQAKQISEQIKQIDERLGQKTEQLMRQMDSKLSEMESRMGENSREIREQVNQLIESQIENLEGKIADNNTEIESQLGVVVDKMAENMRELEEKVRNSTIAENEKTRSAIEGTVDERLQGVDREMEAIRRVVRDQGKEERERLESLESRWNSMQDRIHGVTVDNSISEPSVSGTPSGSNSMGLGNIVGGSNISDHVVGENQDPRNQEQCNLNIVNERSSLGRPQYPTHIINEIGYPVFDEVEFSNPHCYIRELETYFHVKGVPEELKMTVVRKSLRGRPLNWVLVALDAQVSYGEFKTKFSDRYWGQRQQQKIRKEINDSRFDAKKGISMIDYFMELVKKGKSLNPPMPDSELIQTIISHYPENIRYNLIIAGPRDFGETIDLLTALDSSDMTHNGGESYDATNCAEKSIQGYSSHSKAERGAHGALSPPRGNMNVNNWAADRQPGYGYNNNNNNNNSRGQSGIVSPNRNRRDIQPVRNMYNRNNPGVDRGNGGNVNRMRNNGGGPVRRINHIRWYPDREADMHPRDSNPPHWFRNRRYRQGSWQPNFGRGWNNRRNWRRQEQERDRRNALMVAAQQGNNRMPATCSDECDRPASPGRDPTARRNEMRDECGNGSASGN